MAKSILEDRTVTKRMLFPRVKNFEQPFFINGTQFKLSCYLQQRFEDALMIVVFHASNEIVPDYMERFAHEIEMLGCNLLIVEYPGYSMSTGEASLINIFDIIGPVISKSGTLVYNTIVFGRSIGSLYAIDAVNKFPEIKGLIIESGIADFYERIERRVSPEDIDIKEDELKDEVEKYFNIEKKIRLYKGSTLIMHTEEDRVINVKHAHQNFEWANEPKTLKVFKKGGHSDIQKVNQREYFNEIAQFVEKLKP